MSLLRLCLLLATATLAAADKPEGKPSAVAVPRTELKAQVAAGASRKFEFPEMTVDSKGAMGACNVMLPAGYDAAKKVPLVAWLADGEGGNKPSKAFLTEGEFVLVGPPCPKGVNNPAQVNVVGDYGKVWAFHRFMLDEIAKVIPNLDTSR